MEVDKTTIADLSLFSLEEGYSVFSKFNFCNTIGGKARLGETLRQPLPSPEDILGVQQTLKVILEHLNEWPTLISNGSIMVVEKFYESSFDTIPAGTSMFSAWAYKLFHGPDDSLVKYSVQHCFDFIKGMLFFVKNFLKDDSPGPLKELLSKAGHILNKEQFIIVENLASSSEMDAGQQLGFAHFLRYHFKQNMFDLLDVYFQLDTWYAMAKSVKEYDFCFPVFADGKAPFVRASGMYHLLLPHPVDYDVELSPDTNFLFLTGANMAGKSTFIKSLGLATYLAHLGMGVPAGKMELSFFDGMLSNINVADNIVKGESYFYNEVQRIKATVNKIADGRKWLILIDELFKGTNVQDAMKCSTSVIEGLMKIKNSLFVLSTHLYEISGSLQQYSNIQFRYFETSIAGGQIAFSYQLREGVSNDRLGYLILQKEGVIEMLKML